MNKQNKEYINKLRVILESKGDSENLFKATVLDITTTALSFQLNSKYNISATDYIQSAMTVYARNKMLCLYDVKPKVTP
jgi:hypothetical protein